MLNRHNVRQSTALLVMDYQEAVVQMVPPERRKTVLKSTAELIGWARKTSTPLIFVTVQMRQGYPEVSVRNKIFSELKVASVLQAGDPETAMHPEVAPETNEIMVIKRRISSFAGTDLHELLRAMNADSLVLAGLITSGVVLSTVRAAADLDFSLTVIEDACADPDQEVHRVLMEKVFPRQATVVSVKDFLEKKIDEPD